MAAIRQRDAVAWLGPVLLGAAFVPSVIAYYVRLWSFPHYQFFPLALVGAFLLARRGVRDGSAQSIIAPSRIGFAGLLVLSLSLLASSVVLNSPWLGTGGALVAALATAYGLGGRSGLQRFLPAAVMVAVTLRLPLGLDTALISDLQRMTTRLAGGALDLLRATHAVSGNVIEIPGRRLLVEEACSGVNSLFSTFACTVFYLLWMRRGPFVWFVLLTSVPVWVLIANALRIVLVVELRLHWGIAADAGLLHDALGLGVFAFVLWMLACTERLLTFYSAVLAPDELYDPPPAKASTVPEPAMESASRPSSNWAWGVAAVGALALAILQAPDLWGRARDFTSVLRSVELQELGESFVPAEWNGAKRRGYEQIVRDRGSAFGERSQAWTALGSTSRLTWSLDYPFLGWHELTECYTAQGWAIEERTLRGDGPTACVEVKLRHRQTGRYGLLQFSLLDVHGHTMPPRRQGELDELGDRWSTRWQELANFDRSEDRERLTYQFQGFTESFAPITAASAEDFRRSYDELFGRLRADWPKVIR